MHKDFGIKKWPRGVRGDNGEAPPNDDGYDEATEKFSSISHNQLMAILGTIAVAMAGLLSAAAYTQYNTAEKPEGTNAVKPLKK